MYYAVIDLERKCTDKAKNPTLRRMKQNITLPVRHW